VLVRFLLQARADVKKLRPQGMPLHYAANQGHEEIVEELLSHGADINARTYEYCTALQAAAWSGFGSNRMVQLLLEKGADVHAQGGEFGNALQAGAHRSNLTTVRLLLDAGADVNAEGGLYGNAPTSSFQERTT
jgi:ankyrin repeat protein